MTEWCASLAPNHQRTPMTDSSHSEGAGVGPDKPNASSSDESLEITAREASRITGRTTQTLQGWAASGLIPEFRRLPGGKLSFPRASFLAWWDSFLVRAEDSDAEAS